MKRTVDIHNRMIEEAKAGAKGDDYTMFTMIQPWPKLFTDHSTEQGGNMLGLDRFDQNLFRKLPHNKFKSHCLTLPCRGPVRLFMER